MAAKPRAERKCARCGNPLSKDRAKARKKRCYSCEVAVRKEQREAAHDRRVQKLYGLRPGEYQEILAFQGGTCAIKGCRARGISRALAVDHDHKLGLHNRRAVRGICCSKHNKWLGQSGDDPEVFESIAEYLRNPPARKVLK